MSGKLQQQTMPQCNGDNHSDESRADVNCFANPSSFGRKHQLDLRKCKSEANIEGEVRGMGTTGSRSRSLDNVETDSIVYESLIANAHVKRELVEDMDSDDDYKLLESSENDDEGGSDCVTDIIEQISTVKTESENSSSKMDNCSAIASHEGNNDSLSQKSSTLPRVKFKKGNVDREPFARCSAPYASLMDSRPTPQCSTSDEVVSDDHRAAATPQEFLHEPTENDKNSSFRSTTLPKPRSRLAEPYSRYSLRRAIDSTMLRKHSRISDASQSSAVIVPDGNESTSGVDPDVNPKVKRTRSNLSWLRKSMRKLNPFQMPQIDSLESGQQSVPIPSTSETEPRCGGENVAFEKESYIEPVHEVLVRQARDEMLTPCSDNPDFFNVVLTEQQQNSDLSRPRQYGRRSNPVRISSFAIESTNNGAARIIAHHQHERRPASAPVPVERLCNRPSSNVHRSRACLPSEPSSLASSRNSSPVSIASSTGSSSVADPIPDSQVRPRFISSVRIDDDEGEGGDGGGETSKVHWPHLLSRPISCLFCTLGLFNISRFAVYSVHFGANFLVQFLILSFVFGIPMLWLLMVLGQKIKGGIVTMFRIAPICKGIGVALMIAHSIISLYSSVSIAWLLIYLRDSMISSDMQYLWQERFDTYRAYQNVSALRLSENIADYFNGVVLQRLSGVSHSHDGKMRFQLAFSVAIVWTLVFMMLCRGIRSLGKIVIGLAMFCFLGLSAVCIKLLTLLSFETVQDIFPATEWQEFFANSNSWSVASQEAFLTWGLLGVSVYTMYCKTGKNQRLHQHVLRREALLIVFLTLFGLFLGAVLGSTCVIILKLNGFSYHPASYENPKNDISLWPLHSSTVPSYYLSIPSRWITRYSNIIGESFERPIFVNQQGVQIYKESGYKTLRLVTEILPATLAISSRIEPVWGVIVFASLFFFGLAQLGIMWKPICGAIGNSTSAILLSCVTGLFLGFPLTTDNGIVIIHFLDFIFGGGWWLPVLWSSFIMAVFLVRGRPLTSDMLVKDLKFTETLSAFLAFSWNVLLPVALLLLSVMEYKKSYSHELFHQRNTPTANHLSNWPVWVKQLGGFLQLSLLILVPCVALMQIYVYLSKGPRDILDRIELLFRPPMEDPDSSAPHIPIRRLCQQNLHQSQPVIVPLSRQEPSAVVNNDAPPKYSPPPSYSRAVGLRVAKALRNSIRRSMRRFRREDIPRSEATDSNTQNNLPSISSTIPDTSQSFSQSLRVNSQTMSRNVNEFIRSTIHGTDRNTQSVENLMLSDMSLNSGNADNQSTSRNNDSVGNLI